MDILEQNARIPLVSGVVPLKVFRELENINIIKKVHSTPSEMSSGKQASLETNMKIKGSKQVWKIVFQNFRPRNYFISAKEFFSRPLSTVGTMWVLVVHRRPELNWLFFGLKRGTLLPQHTQEVMMLAVLHLLV